MEFMEVIRQRRAVHHFDAAKEVPDELLKQVIEVAALAPSSFNLQPWSVVILREAAQKEKLQSLAWDQPKVSEAPVVLIVLADRNAWKRGHKFLERNFAEMVAAGAMTEDQRDWFVDACADLYGANEKRRQAFACKNAGFFAMALMLAAKDAGLETHPMDGFDHDAVRNAFNIPDNYWIPLLIAVGYPRPDLPPTPPKWRKSCREIVVRFD